MPSIFIMGFYPSKIGLVIQNSKQAPFKPISKPFQTHSRPNSKSCRPKLKEKK
jgi:hypothetical protein